MQLKSDIQHRGFLWHLCLESQLAHAEQRYLYAEPQIQNTQRQKVIYRTTDINYLRGSRQWLQN